MSWMVITIIINMYFFLESVNDFIGECNVFKLSCLYFPN